MMRASQNNSEIFSFENQEKPAEVRRARPPWLTKPSVKKLSYRLERECRVQR
jgi:hypothetical protein